MLRNVSNYSFVKYGHFAYNSLNFVLIIEMLLYTGQYINNTGHFEISFFLRAHSNCFMQTETTGGLRSFCVIKVAVVA